MEERTDQPMFDLYLDQQVFMDSVRGNERIDQYSAYTEVTAFEQRGEDLRLEGHILVAAYLELEGDDGDQVEHVETRLPFEVTVPIYAQMPGMLNVKVQVPELELEILGPGWLHVKALLLVEGLSVEGGATVTCGAQEFHVGETAEDDTGAALAEASTGEAAVPDPPHQWFESDESLTESGWKVQLQGADRAFHGTDPEPGGVSPADVVEEESVSVWDVPADFTQRVESPLAVRGDAPASGSAAGADVPPASGSTADDASVAVDAPRAGASEHTESASAKELVDTRFDLAREEQVPMFPEAQGHIPALLELEPFSPSSTGEPGTPSASYAALPEQTEPMTAAEWFWRTLQIPDSETRYTLKYRIVQAEETLEEIAGFYHVQMTELMAVNQLQNTYASPGDILYIPSAF